jgi:hypothetical protein
MNVAQAQQEIDDTEARYLQDILLDYAGLARRRGPVQALSTVAALPRPATAFASTIDPAGTTRFGALTGTAGLGFLTVWDSTLTTTSDIPWAFPLPTDPVGSAATAYRLSSVTPALNGGSFIGSASDYGTSLSGASQALALWRGGVNADYAVGTIQFTRGSTAVTGTSTAWSASNISPGMFLFANTDDASAGTFTLAYIGTVYSVGGSGSITLEKPAPYSGSAGRTYNLTSLRGTTPKVVKGRITCDTGGTTVSGGNTKFNSQGMSTGTWNIYRQRDFAWVGKVSSVASDISLTLAANAAIAMADELYVAWRGDWSVAEKSTDISGASSKLGWLTAVYAERQWYAANNISFDKTYRLWFSDTGDVEAVDISDDGDWIPIASTTDAPEAIRALIPTYNALLVLKDTESFAVYGSSPDSFSAKKLEDDGTLSTMSVQSYGGGAIWAGRNGIYFYDGVQNTNMTLGKFGAVWENTMRTFDPTRYRMWSMMVRNHYMLHIEKITPTVNTTKGNVVTTPNHWTVVINMETRAFSLFKNVGIRGAVQLPASSGRGVWYLVNDDVAAVGKVCDSTDLFDTENVDTIKSTQGGTLGPDFYYESKKFNAGEDIRLKRIKQISAHYLAQGGNILVDTVIGLNDVGSTLTGNFPASVYTWDSLRLAFGTWANLSTQYSSWNAITQGVFLPKRIHFMKKGHHIAFRYYQSNSSMVRLRLGPQQLGYKAMRPGRI